MKPPKRPAFQWYPGDVRRDTALQACHFEARALWREMLDLMHDGEPYGHLTAGGVPMTDATLARIVGVPVGRVRRWLAELEAHKVFSRTDDGVAFSRRMVKDEHIRNVRAESGKLGGNRELGVEYNEPGFVYAMHRDSDDAIKIGISKSPEKRRWKIEQQFPDVRITLLAKCWVSDMGATEARLHERYKHCAAGEWFGLSAGERHELLTVHLKEKGRVNGQATPPPAVAVAVALAKTSSSSSPDVARLLAGLPGDVMRLSWEAEINAARQGMHGKPLTDDQIAQACRDYVGNGHLATPSLRHFRAFLASAGRPPRDPSVAEVSPFRTPAMLAWAAEKDAEDAQRAKEKIRA